MNRIFITLLAAIVFFGCSSPVEKPSKPNIVYILADDLGYGEVGYQGQEKIHTPNIDALAASGMIFTNHYSGAPVCAPARCILLTGRHGGHAYIRGNDEWRERGEVWDYAKAAADPNLEGQRPLPVGTVTLASILQKEGYKTGIVGKWGLGAPTTESIPSKMGFDYFYGYNCQRQAHNLYPPHLWENDNKVSLDNPIVVPNTKLDEGADPNVEESYSKYNQADFAPTLMHEKALKFIEENKEEPFFLYYASPLPHVPLQAPQNDVDKYRNEYGSEEPYLGNNGYFPNQYPHATYAAMISLFDQHVGEVKAKLKELGLEENTIIIVTSDNGPTYTGGVDFDYFESSNPFTNGYGRTKGFVYEGGIRIPMLVNWPGKVEAGSKSDLISAFYDVMPTICELVGAPVPDDADGKSFLPTLLGKAQPDPEFLFWEYPEYGGQQAVRMGKWKGIRQNIIKEGNLEIELYDLSIDPQELKNIADDHPEIVRKIEEIMKKEHATAELDRFKMAALGD
ncbi:arylsulfatase [Algoriphagus aestuarii]|nr:arylsulfatase [Algoriphagus aestuarii]